MKFKQLAFACALALSTVASTSLASTQTQSAPQISQDCQAPDYSRNMQIPWFLGLHPLDDLLNSFCRVQQLPGDLRFNILFPSYNVHRSWDISFDGKKLPATEIVRMVQSTLPAVDGPAKDENNMEFHKVLQSVVQLQAQETPSGRPLGFAPEHPSSKELVLWEPIIIRVKPVVMAGEEFVMTVTLKPNLGILALALQGKATDVRFRGWKGRMKTGGLFGRGCSSAVPACEDLQESPIFHAPWLVSDVRLEAHGNNMTNAAATIMDRLSLYPGTKTKTMNIATGSGLLTADDTITKLEMKAEGSSSGTKSIVITWQPIDNKHSVAKQAYKKFPTLSKSAHQPQIDNPAHQIF